jgi:predicted Rossmann fold flavoprotein
MNSPATYDAIILGAGAAGMMAAAVAGQNGRRVLLADHADAPGKKILISGGGRCNFTNIHTAPDRYLSANPHFARSALSRYTPADFIELVDRYGIAWHEKTLGQLFCDGSAKQIVAMLLDQCMQGGVELSLGRAAGEVGHADGMFSIALGNRTVSAPKLVIATGGPSIPKMGATGFAYDVARRFGLKVFRDLSGVATEVVASAGQGRFREAALFTHRGLSGPAILQVSSYWRSGEAVAIDFLPDRDAGWLLAEKRARPRATIRSTLGSALPDRLAETLAERLALSGNLADLPDKALATAEAQLAGWAFHPNGTEGFAKAEVTIGGVATDGLSQKTMEAKAVPGLHFIGEAVDVTGWLGGYNFQWAWASAAACGEAL